jgi:hypothetical protein
LGAESEDIKATLRLLSNTRHEWLLILDNADNHDTDYMRYIPSGFRGSVLLTSRSPDCQVHSTVGYESLSNLDPVNSMALLFRAAKIREQDQSAHKDVAKRILDVLGSHTLAIIQAGAYISNRFCTMKDYPNHFARQSQQLLKFDRQQDRPRYGNVYATFEVSAQYLSSSEEQSSQDALCLLDLLAIFHYDAVPIMVFEDARTGICVAREIEESSRIDTLTRWHTTQLPPFMQAFDVDWDPNRIHEARVLLESLALITTGDSNGLTTVSMHPLIHTWGKKRQKSDKQQKSWESTGCLFALSYYYNVEWQPYRDLLRLHLLSFFEELGVQNDQAFESPHMTQMVFQQARLLSNLRMDLFLMRLLEDTLQVSEVVALEASEELLPLLKLYSENLYFMGNISSAVQTWKK